MKVRELGFLFYFIYIYIYGSGMDNIHTLPDYVLPIKNRVLPKTFGSGRVRYPLPNRYDHPYVRVAILSLLT